MCLIKPENNVKKTRIVSKTDSHKTALGHEDIDGDIDGASLGGRIPQKLQRDELRFWLKCRGMGTKPL